MKPCESQILLSRYHDRELTDPQRQLVQAHLRDCPSCAAELEQMQGLSQSLRSAVAEVTPKASPQFLARLQALAPDVERQTVLRFVRRLTAAAAAILVGTTVLWTVDRHPPAQPVQSTSSLGSEEKAVLDPDLAVASAGEDARLSTEPQADFIPQDLSGGRQ